jgi:hypothetical protein
MPTKPWYKIVTPREELHEGKPLDASEFAIHLDQVREGRAKIEWANESAERRVDGCWHGRREWAFNPHRT